MKMMFFPGLRIIVFTGFCITFLFGLHRGPSALSAQSAVMGTLTQSAQVIIELKTAGMVAGLPDIPVNTEVRITNDSNGKTITANVIERMAKARGRVINLSEDAAKELGVKRGDWVRVVIPSLIMPTQPTGTSSSVAESKTQAAPQNPSNIIINNYYIFDPDKMPVFSERAFEQNNIIDPFETEQTIIQEMPLETKEPEMIEVRIIGLPNSGDTGTYRLQVGAYFEIENALSALNKIQDNGYVAEMEEIGGDIYRVYAADISAPDVQTEAYRLVDLGFRQIWIRKED